MAYPTNTNLETLLTSLGIPAPSGLDTSSIIAQAIFAWEQGTGYVPFISTNATRYYDPPGFTDSFYNNVKGGTRLLKLDCGLLTLTSLTIGGVTKTAGTDFQLMPYNNPAMSKPYEWIKFAAPVYGQAKSVVVVGDWGRVSTVVAGDAVFQAVLTIALGFSMGIAGFKISGGSILWEEGDVKEEFGTEIYSVLKQNVDAARNTLSMYTRVEQWGF